MPAQSHAADPGRVIAFEIHIRAAPEQVWKMITDPREIPRWSYPVAVELDALKVGGRYTFKDKQGPDDSAEIVVFEPNRRLVYRWKSSEPEPTFVEYELTRDGDCTRLRFRNHPFKSGPAWDKFYEANFKGWLDFTIKLKQLAEQAIHRVEHDQVRGELG